MQNIYSPVSKTTISTCIWIIFLLIGLTSHFRYSKDQIIFSLTALQTVKAVIYQQPLNITQVKQLESIIKANHGQTELATTLLLVTNSPPVHKLSWLPSVQLDRLCIANAHFIRLHWDTIPTQDISTYLNKCPNSSLWLIQTTYTGDLARLNTWRHLLAQHILKLDIDIGQWTWLQLGRFLRNNGNEDMALLFFKSAYEAGAKRDIYYIEIVATYIQMQEYQIAFDTLELLLKNEPVYLDAYYQYARLSRLNNDYPMAVTAIEQALVGNSENIWYWMELGRNLELLGRWTVACEAYHRAYSISPNTAQTSYEFGSFFLRQGYLEQSYNFFEIAAINAPNNSEYQASLDALQDNTHKNEYLAPNDTIQASQNICGILNHKQD